MNTQRSFQFPAPGPLTKGILAAIALSFLGTYALMAFAPKSLEYLVLNPDAVLRGRLWTLVTYVLVQPGDMLNTLFIALSVYFFGTALEQRWGRQRFLIFMAVVALVGGVAVTAGYLAGFAPTPVAGAHPIAFALFAAWALTFPEREILLFFVLPVKGKYLFWFEVVLVVVQVVRGGLAAVPDVGGLLVAVALVYGVFRLDTLRDGIDRVLVALRLKKKPKLHVVPKWGEDGANKFVQ